MLKAGIHLDLESLAQSKSGRITGNLAIRVGKLVLPDPNWNDFVVVVLKWWLEQLRQPGLGPDSVVLRFMDGPNAIRLTPVSRGEARIAYFDGAKDVDFDDRVDLTLFESEIRKSARLLLSAIKRKGWQSQDVSDLEATLAN